MSAGGGPCPLEVEDLLMWLAAEQGRSPNTISAYRRDLRRYTEWLRRARPHASPRSRRPTSSTTWPRSGPRASRPASVARALVAVRSLHRFLAEEGRVALDPSGQRRAARRCRKGLPKALSEEEVGRLLAAPVGDDPIARRDRAILEVLYGTGLRISELVGLSLGDLDLDDALLRAFGKGSKERIVPVGGHAVAGPRGLAGRGRPARAGAGAVAPAGRRRGGVPGPGAGG